MKLKKEESKKVQRVPREEYEPIYTIGVAAMKLGISVHSFRQYETEGLIIPYKTSTGRRLYSDLELEKVTCIKSMIQDEGLNFAGIRRLLAMIPCWKLKNCPKSSVEKCLAFKDRIRPCWASEAKCAHPLPSCRDCEVYRKIVHCDDILPLIYNPGK
jgi:MerR family transcriptional regulator/heat shock protein HspR